MNGRRHGGLGGAFQVNNVSPRQAQSRVTSTSPLSCCSICSCRSGGAQDGRASAGQSKRDPKQVSKGLIEHICGISSQMGTEDFRVVGTIIRRGKRRSGCMWVTLLSLGLLFFPPLTSHFISFTRLSRALSLSLWLSASHSVLSRGGCD